MGSEWWEAFWFFLPAGISNASPVLANRIPGLNRWTTPLDFGKHLRDRRIFGDHKSWRGILFGTLMAGIFSLVQYQIIEQDSRSVWLILITGMALGFGALFGDAVASFFKRRSDVAPGESWFPVDQTDYIIGGLLFVYPFVELSRADVLRILVMYFVLHIVASYIAFHLKLKEKPI